MFWETLLRARLSSSSWKCELLPYALQCTFHDIHRKWRCSTSNAWCLFRCLAAHKMTWCHILQNMNVYHLQLLYMPYIATNTKKKYVVIVIIFSNLNRWSLIVDFRQCTWMWNGIWTQQEIIGLNKVVGAYPREK